MELPSSGYFYALAALSMAFVGFTSIVVVLRQGSGKPLSLLHVLFTSTYSELGLMATTFAMLAPTLAICGIDEILVWRISSTIVLAVLLMWFGCFPKRRKTAAPEQNIPPRFYIMATIGLAVAAYLIMNIAGSKPGPGPVALATVFALAVAAVIFLRNYSLNFRD